MRIRLIFSIALTTLIFLSANSNNAQTPDSPQVYQGCAAGTVPYPPETFIWGNKNSKGKRNRIRINKVAMSDARMVFTFVPEKAVVEKDQTLNLKVFSYGRETEYEKENLQNPSTLKSLNVPPIDGMPEFKKSQLAEEDYQYMYWDGTPLGTVKHTENIYAIIHKKSDFANGLTPNIIPVTSPEKYLQQNSIPTFLIPPTFYYYKGKLVKVAGEYDSNDKEKIPSIPSAIRIIKLIPGSDSTGTFTFDTTGLEEGEYYVTLQGTAIFEGQTLRTCDKTTPPVVITIQSKIYYSPELYLTKYEQCSPFQYTVTAKAEDKNVPTRKLVFEDWKVTAENGDVVPPTYYKILKYVSENSEILEFNSTLKNGKYKVEVTVDNGVSPKKTKSIDLNVYDCPTPQPPSGSGAGIAYFGNATPDYRKGEIIRDPEEWTKDTERKRPAKEGKYPTEEYQKFYTATNTKPFEFDPDGNANQTMIDRIVDVLDRYPESTVYILGYADRRKTGTYRNDLLAKQRITSVVETIIATLKTKYPNNPTIPNIEQRVIGGEIIYNCGDLTADRDYNSKIWDLAQRWDRRVEIIYGYNNQIPSIPSYAEKCPKIRIDLLK